MKRLQTLALEQKEDARHGDATFPIQKYITSLKPDYPVITTHWHEEAEFTLITEGDASYQIDLTSYAVEKDDLIFIPPLLLHSVSRGQSALYQSETYVFHMNFLGGNATDICSTRYLMPLTNEELSVPCLIRPTHPAYVSLRKIFAQIVLSLQIRLRDTNCPLRHYCCRLFSCSCSTVPRTGNDLSTPQTPLKN